MKNFINEIQESKTCNSNPGTNTDLANSLELLSSGIYTEEERFIFELLQNAVDAHDNDLNDDLRIRIEFKDDFLIFMHNGSSFTRRDIEGICSVGNGGKIKDIKKIGYKGIGFKSVFMHSDCVYIKSDDIVFRFEKEHWGDFYNDKVSESGREYKMPWQIMPIYTEFSPVSVENSTFKVCTYIKLSNLVSLYAKTAKLLEDCQFLLFLRNNNITIELFSNDTCQKSIRKTSSSLIKLDENVYQTEISLFLNEKEVSRWMMYKNNMVLVPESVKEIIRKDPKTPQKLQNSASFDLSFAISMDKSGQLVKLDKSVLYTYLPTSCDFGLPFLVNANFMTDAGRQQLITDTEWNKMIVGAIPEYFLLWMSSLSNDYTEYVEILPSLKNSYKTLGEVFEKSLINAIKEIAFIPGLTDVKCKHKVGDCLVDKIGLSNGISKSRFDFFVQNQYKRALSYNSLVAPRGIDILKEYGAQILKSKCIADFLENTENYFKDITNLECQRFCSWLCGNTKLQKEEFIIFLRSARFLLDDNNQLTAPEDLFFPSKFKEENDIAQSAKLLSMELLNLLMGENLKDWLYKIGVQEMSQLSVVSNLLCKDNFITEENAVETLRFIFDVDNDEDIFKNISIKTLQNIKVLSTTGELKNITQLYIDQFYKSTLIVDFNDIEGRFISHEYMRVSDDPFKWLLFFKKLGASDSIKITKTIYNKTSKEFESLSAYTTYAEKHEYNTSWDGRRFPMYPSQLFVKFVPIIDLFNTHIGVCKLAWNNVFSQKVMFERNDDYISGSTGCGYFQHAYLLDNCEGHRYLGKNYLPWVLQNYKVLPATDGKMYYIQELFENTEYNENLLGSYFPVLDIDCCIDVSWEKHLTFKPKIDLDTCLNLLEKISLEEDDLIQKDNCERVSLIYKHICDNFNLSKESSDYIKLVNWGRTGKILSTNHTFNAPSELLLVSDELGKLDIDNQVYRGKHIENKNRSIVLLMQAFGVVFINDFKTSYEDGSEENFSLKDSIRDKKYFISLLAAGSDCTSAFYEQTLEKVQALIDNMHFIQEKGISLIYGDNRISKKVYSEYGNFHYVGQFNIANIELLHYDLSKYLSVGSSKAVLIPILQMSDFGEIYDYLEEKGYNVSLIPQEALNKSEIELPTLNNESGTVLISLSDTPYSGLSSLQMREALIDAKKAVQLILSQQGYVFTKGLCEDDYGNIYGVYKEGTEYPLVVHSYKNQNRPFQLTSFDWDQLAKPNSMLWVNTYEGVKCIPFYALAKDRGRINISFDASNFDLVDRSKALAQILRYFKGLHFDFGTMLPICSNQIEIFNSPEKPISEVLHAKSDDLMM